MDYQDNMDILRRMWELFDHIKEFFKKSTAWRNHTCGECGYCMPHQKAFKTGTCRNHSWLMDYHDDTSNTLYLTTPACPDFVPREDPCD